MLDVHIRHFKLEFFTKVLELIIEKNNYSVIYLILK